MQIATFQAKCPYEIGDRMIVERVHEIVRTQNGWEPRISRKMATITDIATVHYVKTGKVVFKYEFNHSGEYVELAAGSDYAARKV